MLSYKPLPLGEGLGRGLILYHHHIPIAEGREGEANLVVVIGKFYGTRSTAKEVGGSEPHFFGLCSYSNGSFKVGYCGRFLLSTIGITPVHRGYSVEIDKMHYILAVHGFGESCYFILRCRPSRYGCIFGSYLR
jgi:hypothetical protein